MWKNAVEEEAVADVQGGGFFPNGHHDFLFKHITAFFQRIARRAGLIVRRQLDHHEFEDARTAVMQKLFVGGIGLEMKLWAVGDAADEFCFAGTARRRMIVVAAHAGSRSSARR